MPSFSWIGATGAWGDPSQWTPTGVPATGADTATIDAAGAYAVTIAEADSFAPGGIVIDAADASVIVNGVLDTAGGTIALNSGTLALGATGSVSNTVLDLQGGLFIAMGGTLIDATVRGPLVFADGMTLAVGGGLSLLDASGAAPGTIDMAGLGSTLNILNDMTLDAASLSVGGAGSGLSIVAGATLTLGSALAASFTAGSTDITGTFVNNGTLTTGGAGVTYVHDGSQFLNTGEMDIADGQFRIGSTLFVNTGILHVASGGTLAIDAGVSVANGGTISLDAGGTLSVSGSQTPAQILAMNVIPNGGVLEIAGTLDLGGGTLALDGVFAGLAVPLGGTIANGTIDPTAGTLAGGGGLLSRVTWLGSLDVGDDGAFFASGGLTISQPGGGTLNLGSFSVMEIADGLTLGTGGSIGLGGDLSILGFQGDTTLDALGVSMAGANTTLRSELGTLTLGPDASLDLSGDGVTLLGPMVNRGTISLTAGSTTIGDFIDPSVFSNQGTVAVTGGRLVINDTSFSNAGLIDIGTGGVVSIDTIDSFVNPGTIVVGLGGTLELLDSMNLADLVSGNLEGAGGTLVVGGPLDLQTGTMDIELTPASSVIELISGGTILNGTIHVGGGPFVTSGGTLESIVHEGTLRVTAFGSLAAQGGLTVTGLDGTGSGTIALDDGGSLALRDNVVLGGGRIEMSGDLANLSFDQDMTLSDLTVAVTGSSAEIDVASATLTLATTARLDLATDFGFSYGNVVNQGSIALTFGTFVIDDWNPGDRFANDGALDVSGGRFIIASDLFINTGVVTIGTLGYLEIDAGSAFTGSGTIGIGTAGTLDIGGASAASVGFTGNGRLILDDAAGYTGTIGGLAVGTQIQLTGQTVIAASITGTTLTADLDGGGSVAYTIDPTLPGLTVDIATGDDGLADLLVVLCFHAGTRLLTADGPRAVEALRTGDRLRTARGELRPIRWVGSRSFDCARHPDPRAVRPVRIAAGAFGPAQPERELLLSPDHAVLADDVLVPVRHLVNGTSIRQMPASRVTYYHVELDTHDIVLAEGLAVETYLDVGDRDSFDDAASLRLHPAFGQGPDVALIREALACAPFAVTGPVVGRLRERLARAAVGASDRRAGTAPAANDVLSA